MLGTNEAGKDEENLSPGYAARLPAAMRGPAATLASLLVSGLFGLLALYLAEWLDLYTLLFMFLATLAIPVLHRILIGKRSILFAVVSFALTVSWMLLAAAILNGMVYGGATTWIGGVEEAGQWGWGLSALNYMVTFHAEDGSAFFLDWVVFLLASVFSLLFPLMSNKQIADLLELIRS
jgi:hypothetical protein